MTEKELIQKLRLLNTIEPNKDWAFSAQKRMFALIAKESGSRQHPFLGFSFSNVRFAPVAISMFAVLVVIGGFLMWENAPSQNGGVRAIISQKSLFHLPFIGDDSRSAFVKNEYSSESKHNVNTAIVSENVDEKEFQKILFGELEEKLLVLGQQIPKIAGSAKVDTAKELLLRAQSALNEGDLIEAFDVLVSLERFLEQ